MSGNELKSLKSVKKLLKAISNYKPEINRLLLKKIQDKTEEQHIKLMCSVIFILWTIILVMGIVFFGYKLYKSLVERERRREEKKRQKLQKKKK